MVDAICCFLRIIRYHTAHEKSLLYRMIQAVLVQTPDRKFMMNSKVYYRRLYTAGGRIVPAFASQRWTTKTWLAIVYKPCKDFTIADRSTYFAVGYKRERYLPVMCRILREIASLKK